MLPLASSVRAMSKINVYSKDGQLIVAIDTLGTDSTPEYLEHKRAALRERTARARPQYLILVQPRGFYLWHADAEPNTAAQFAPLDSIVQDFAPSLAADAENLHPCTLPNLINTWLNFLAFGLQEPDAHSKADQLLIESGIYQRILDGISKIEGES